ncbi:MAG: hypothetical protein D6752_07065 [Candidatus Nitrosothermus koennekii]|nr:MAG: hypothetical protein D6752_07065 [Candidatus Nitrosothermus koennekii]
MHKEVFWKEYDKCTAYSLATLDMIEEGKPPYKIFLWIDMDNNVLELEGDLLWEHRDNLMKIIGY